MDGGHSRSVAHDPFSHQCVENVLLAHPAACAEANGSAKPCLFELIDAELNYFAQFVGLVSADGHLMTAVVIATADAAPKSRCAAKRHARGLKKPLPAVNVQTKFVVFAQCSLDLSRDGAR